MRSRLLTALAVAAVVACAGPAAAEPAPEKVPFSEFLSMVRGGSFGKVDIAPSRSQMVATTKDGRRFETSSPAYQTLVDDVVKSGAVATFDMGDGERTLALSLDIVGRSLVIVMMLSFLVFFLLARSGRLKMSGGGQRFRRGRKGTMVTFADVAGAEEAKEELTEIVAYLKDHTRFSDIGARTPRGILLLGPPGNGKTLLAKAVAGEAGVPFHFCTGSDFVEMFAGLGARRVRTTFRNARSRKPSVLFIDEIDALGRKRNGSSSDVGREHDQTLNALLTELDGMETKHGLVVIAATNLAETLDPALVRAGRFDRHVVVALPTLGAREEILGIHARKVPLSDCVDLAAVARATPGFSGAELEALVNDAALEAQRAGQRKVRQADFEAARDSKLLGGRGRRTGALTEEETRTIAFHEAGHALAATVQKECDAVHKATIVPRGRSLGAVSTLPERDRVLVRRSKMMADLVMAMAGRAAEEIAFGADDVTAGAVSDIEEATAQARNMVARFGLGGRLSNRMPGASVSPETLREVDEEVERLVSDAYARALSLLRQHEHGLHALAAALRERETLDGDEVRSIILGARPALAFAS